MAVHLHRATRTDRLADGLAQVLADPLADPFASELVVVPAKGIERWLSQRLSHRLGESVLGAGNGDGPGGGDGVCAGVSFRSPRSLIAELLGVEDDDPWAPDPMSWRVLEAIDEHLGEPWAAPLARHLGAEREEAERELRLGRRYGLARRIAGLFAAYALQRPAVLADWSAGGDTDGADGQVPADLAWQPPLWRATLERSGSQPPHQRHADTLAMITDDPGALQLPDRLSLFGHTRIPTTEVELLAALGRERQVHLWLPHPSPALWDALAGQLVAASPPVVRRRRDDLSHRAAVHPLLSSLGRDLRELQQALVSIGAEQEVVAEPTPVDGETLLGWLQADLAANQAPDSARRRLQPADRSVQFHACHGPARQVEVLREVLLGLLADDPTLEPRDIVVMCPDIEAYAPLVQACFGLVDVVGHQGHPAHQLRVKLADRALVQTNPLLSVAASLLELASGRAKASEVLALAQAGPVRRRFGFSDDDLDQLATWISGAGIRWSFDAEHRADFGLADFVQNTWRFGLDRLLTGVTLSEDAGGWLDRTLPLDDVGSGQIDLAGRFVEFIDRLQAATDRLVGTQPLSRWQEGLIAGLEALTAVSMADAWQPGQAQRELASLGAEHPDAVELRLSDVRSLLRGRLAGRPTRANFRTGTLTVCSMVPMRSVPHRVICLLGLDDGVFPRSVTADGDDLLARDPLVGERDLRAEDRQLLLDAVCAAGQTLVVTYTGADVLTGQPRPPAVPVGELLDALDLTASADAGAVRDRILTHHPLQPYDVRNVVPGGIVGDGLFSFDPSAVAGAKAAAAPRRAPVPLRKVHLPAPEPSDIGLEELIAFLKSPAKGFLTRRLQISLPFEEDPLADGIQIEVDGLSQWSVGDRVVTDLLNGIPPDLAKQREWRRGALPPGRLGWRQLGDIVEQSIPLAREAHRLREWTGHTLDIDLALDPNDPATGRRLTGTVGPIFGSRLVPVSYSRLGAAHRLQSWIRLLAASAQDPDHSYTAHTLGRGQMRHGGVEVSRLGPVDDHTALDLLRDLVAIYDEGMSHPLPMPLKSASIYAQYRRSQASTFEAMRVARKRWRDDRFPGEQSDREHVQLWGFKADLPGSRKDGWGELAPWGEPDEPAPFGAYAVRVWRPLLDAENLPW